ncbi:MAG: hypothetical protein IRZ06_06090 [Nevskia sp.]|nr:hypothetical protein [Nevskia sp.]
MNHPVDHVRANYEAFKKKLPELLAKYPGKFALMRDENIVEIFDTAADAAKAGKALYADGRYSIQEITGTPVNLGFFSYAVH